jgi:DNA-binding IclR family transcriptional regulator
MGATKMAGMDLSKSTTWRVMLLLEALAASRDGLGIRETSRRIGIDKSAVGRLLTQLQEMDLVRQSAITGRYLVGPRLYALGATLVAQDSMTRAARPLVKALAARFNETCYLGIREASGCTFRVKFESTHAIRYVADLGVMAPFHAGAGGRAILAGMTPEELHEELRKPRLEPLTDATITDRRTLRKRITEDRARGFSISMGERVRESTAIAAPFFDASGICRGSIVLARPAVRHSDGDVGEISAAVMEAARELSERLGYVPEPGPGTGDGAPQVNARSQRGRKQP